jgi:hypothetical protein
MNCRKSPPIIATAPRRARRAAGTTQLPRGSTAALPQHADDLLPRSASSRDVRSSSAPALLLLGDPSEECLLVNQDPPAYAHDRASLS